MANSTYLYQEFWENRIAQRLDKPQTWKEVCDVTYSDTQILNFPLIATSGEPAVSTGKFASAAERTDLTKVITFIPVTQTNQTLGMITTDVDAVYLDYADQAQSNYASYAQMGDLLGKKIGERVETVLLANHANWTNFGDTGGGVLGLASTTITVSANNVDDIIRGVIEEIYTANGFDLYKQNGGFIVWRPEDWTFLVQFMQSNGFNLADANQKNGGKIGVEYLGLKHYVSTSHAANHLFSGVSAVQKLGLLKSTFGKTYVTETPPSSTAGMLSGTGIHTRLDYGLLVPTNLLPIVFDVNVV